MICLLNPSLAVFPLQLEYVSWPMFLLLVGIASAYIVLLGQWSFGKVNAVRKWVTISIRLLVILLLGLILGGARWSEVSKNLEVVVIRDVSPSVGNVSDFPGQTLQSSIDKYITDSANHTKPADDLFGQISFDQSAMIDVLPSIDPAINSGAIRSSGTGTDIANAIQLGLATFSKSAMRRLVLITDGNATQGDTDAAINAAKEQGVPIDVMPLHYDIQHEVLMDKIVAPAWRRENEPFTLDIYIKSTNDTPVTGKLTVSDMQVPLDLDPATPGVQPAREVTLPPGTPEHPSVKVEHIRIPAQQSAGVHQFHAYFDPDKAGGGVTVATGTTGSTGTPAASSVDTLGSNNGGDAFTYIQGKGRILYVDDVPDEAGDTLSNALNEEGIAIAPGDHITSSAFPSSLIELQNYDAVILQNVRYGSGGLTDDQQRNLSTYVHDMGGGLVMIGGPDTFGAGGWQGRQLEEILPVSMDIPAVRQIPKGALVLAMDAAESFNGQGNYWGMQCAIKACEALSAQDDIGIISYGQGGCNWDLPLGPKGDGSKAIAAVKNWWMGDLPSFEDAVTLAMNGDGNSKGLLADDAAAKHIIVITDDDPQMPTSETIAKLRAAKISVSTITVCPHQPHNVAPGTRELAKLTGGRSFGPIEDNPEKLPQIFVKEATVVRRSLIYENRDGIPLHRRTTTSEMVKGLGDQLPMIRGMVLTSRKNNPQIQLAITAGANSDPVLASWQTGLGRAAVYTSDATNKWGVQWVGSPAYNKLWAQVVRGVARPPMSDKFEVSMIRQGDRGHIVVEASDKDSGFMNFLNLRGNVVSPNPDKPAIDPHLVQTGPGRYEGDFDLNDAGTYVAVMQYSDQNGNAGNLPVAGLSMNSSAEMRDLQSNDSILSQIKDRTGGRLLPAFDSVNAGFFNHEGLPPAISTRPIWDQLIPFLLGLILVDVAARRIAWDPAALRRYAVTSAGMVRSFTTTRQVETRASLDALKRVRTDAEANRGTLLSQKPDMPVRPNPSAKFEAKGVAGDITSVVGGATDKPIPSAPKKIEPKGGGAAGGGMNSLLEAKRRAQQMIKDKESGEK